MREACLAAQGYLVGADAGHHQLGEDHDHTLLDAVKVVR